MKKINTTFRCNNNCKYCPIDKTISLKEPTLNYIKSSIRETSNFNAKIIMLTGGESLLRKDVFEIIKEVKKNGFSVVLKTNGRMAFYEKYIQAIKKSKIKSIILNFPSHNPKIFNNITQTKGSYYQTIFGIKNIVSAGINLKVNIVVSKKNYKKLKNIFTILKRMGVKEIILNYPELKGNTVKYSKEILFNINKFSKDLNRVLCFARELNFNRIYINNKFLPSIENKKKYILSYDKDFKMYVYENNLNIIDKAETHVYIQTNTTCNQKCVFCNRPPIGGYNKGDAVQYKNIKKKINQLSRDPYIKRVIFTGGEPVLYPELAKIIHHTKKYGFITEIQTNGTLLSRDKLLEFKKAGLDIINFAFHSHKKKTSNKLRGVNFGHEKIINNLKLANKLGFEIHIIHVINSINYKDLPEFIEYINHLELKDLYLNLSIVVPEGWAWENKWIIPRMIKIKPYLIKAMKKCKRYNLKFDVSEIVPLCIVNGFEDHAISTLFKLSNVKISDDYYTGSRVLDFVNTSTEQAIKAPQCKNCSFDKICAGFYPRLKELYGVDDFIPRHDNPLSLFKKINLDDKTIELFKNKNYKSNPSIPDSFKGKVIETFKHKKERKPDILYINLDEKCNENCVFCVVKGSNVGNFGAMKASEAKKIIKEFIKNNGKTIVFTGGEPTLRKDLPSIIKYAEGFDKLKSISIITNGTVLANKDYLDKLICADKDKKVSFCFSLHSHKKDISELLTSSKNTFNKTILGIENVINKKRKVSIYQVITSRNYKDLLGFSKFLNKRYPEIKDITFAYPFPQGNALLNKWIYVKLSNLRSYFLKALKFLEKKGYVINIAACGQFPLCAISGFEEKVILPLTDSEENISGVVGEKTFHEFEMASDEWVNQYKGKSKECQKCILNKYCQGFWKEYMELFGFDGIKPVTQNNFKGNKIKTVLKNNDQFKKTIDKLVKNKINLVIITSFTDNYLKKLIEKLKENKMFGVILYKKETLYPL